MPYRHASQDAPNFILLSRRLHAAQHAVAPRCRDLRQQSAGLRTVPGGREAGAEHPGGDGSHHFRPLSLRKRYKYFRCPPCTLTKRNRQILCLPVGRSSAVTTFPKFPNIAPIDFSPVSPCLRQVVAYDIPDLFLDSIAPLSIALRPKLYCSFSQTKYLSSKFIVENLPPWKRRESYSRKKWFCCKMQFLGPKTKFLH